MSQLCHGISDGVEKTTKELLAELKLKNPAEESEKWKEDMVCMAKKQMKLSEAKESEFQRNLESIKVPIATFESYSKEIGSLSDWVKVLKLLSTKRSSSPPRLSGMGF